MAKQAGTDHPLERLVFFSDAVFAIAITLLVIELHVPTPPGGSPPEVYWSELAHMLPKFGAFALSFLVIGMFWMGHHRLFSRTSKYDPGMLWPNLLFLMSIAFTPFATAFMGANGDRFVPALFYNLSLLASALLIWLLARKVAASPGYSEGPDEAKRSAVTVAAAAVCVALSFVAPQFSQIGMLLAIFGRRISEKKG